MARDDDDDFDDEEDDRPRKKKKKKKGGRPNDEEKQMAMFCHLGGIIGGFLLPLIIWIIKKEESRYIDEHGKQALNFAITVLIAHLVGFVCTCGFLSIVLAPITIIFSIQGAMAASRGEDYEYPMSFSFIS